MRTAALKCHSTRYLAITRFLYGRQETVETAEQFVSDLGYSFPVFYDTERIAASEYGVHSVPRTYFIDAEGYLIDSVYKVITKEQLLAVNEKLNAVKLAD